MVLTIITAGEVVVSNIAVSVNERLQAPFAIVMSTNVDTDAES